MLDEELEWRRSMMDEERQLELNAPLESNGQAQYEQPNPRFWLWRLFGG
jgi:hypothetical protein